MSLGEDLAKETTAIFGENFQISKGWSIPSTADIAFGSQGKQIKLVSLFVDIRKSTRLVSQLGLTAAARMYKAYTRGITKLVRARGGEILSFNGDGIVAGFVGANANNAAILTALNIHWFLYWQLRPQVDAYLVATNAPADLAFDYGIGIDAGDVLIVKAGMTGEDNNGLIWAGNPVNYSVKVSSLASLPHAIYVADEVFTDSHYSLSMVESQFVWTIRHWEEKDKYVWNTNWFFSPDYLTSVPESAPPKPSLLPTPKKTLADFMKSLPPSKPSGSILDLIQPKPKTSILDSLAAFEELTKKK